MTRLHSAPAPGTGCRSPDALIPTTCSHSHHLPRDANRKIKASAKTTNLTSSLESVQHGETAIIAAGVPVEGLFRQNLRLSGQVDPRNRPHTPRFWPCDSPCVEFYTWRTFARGQTETDGPDSATQNYRCTHHRCPSEFNDQLHVSCVRNLTSMCFDHACPLSVSAPDAPYLLDRSAAHLRDVRDQRRRRPPLKTNSADNGERDRGNGWLAVVR